MVAQLRPVDFLSAATSSLELAVVVPVLNEHDNIEPLLTRLSFVLAGIQWEAIFVDDGSTDGTPELIESIGRGDRRVRLIRRFGRRGLSSAVVEGFLSSVAPVLAVMDGDMQHDETLLPSLYEAITQQGQDLAIGTRYTAGGSIGNWSVARSRISRWATWIARPVIRTPLSDPMSGFFMIRRETLLEAVPNLSAIGYKILLDIVASSPRPLRFTELPYVFRSRVAGTSKLDAMIVVEYIELLLDKIVGRIVPVRLILFSVVGLFGATVHFSTLWATTTWASMKFIEAQSIAVAVAMTFNYVLNNRFTYRDQRLRGWAWWRGYVSFVLACSVGALANVGVGAFIFDVMGHSLWMGGLAGVMVGTVWNYAATRWLTWTRRRPS